MLSTLATRQETYRAMVRGLRNQDDRSFSDAVLASQGIDEDALVNVATVLYELSRHEPMREPQETDILWSQEFIDHLDTLGMEVRFKQKSEDTPS